MIYIFQEIDRLSEHLLHLSSLAEQAAPEGQPRASPYDDRAAIEAFLNSENSPALFLLLCSHPRMLIRMICSPLRHGWAHCVKGEKMATTPQARDSFSLALSKYNNSPICVHVQQSGQGQVPGISFELFSMQVEQLIKEAYSSAGITNAEKPRIERDMLIRTRIPEVLMPALKKLLTETWPNFISSPNVDFGAIYKHDIAWLGFTEDHYTQQWHKRHVVDIVRKTRMPIGIEGVRKFKIRTCTRCGSKMEDIQPSAQWPGWVIGNMKNCVCLGNWGEVEG